MDLDKDSRSFEQLVASLSPGLSALSTYPVPRGLCPTLWFRDFPDAGCQEPAAFLTCALQNPGRQHGHRATHVSMISVFADRLCAAASRENAVWTVSRASDEEGNLESDAFPSQCPAP